MFTKLIIALCAVGLASASGLWGAPVVARTVVSPGVNSYSAYSTAINHGTPIVKVAAVPAINAYGYGSVAGLGYGTGLGYGSVAGLGYGVPALGAYRGNAWW